LSPLQLTRIYITLTPRDATGLLNTTTATVEKTLSARKARYSNAATFTGRLWRTRFAGSVRGISRWPGVLLHPQDHQPAEGPR
jgi:hypothetical protein